MNFQSAQKAFEAKFREELQKVEFPKESLNYDVLAYLSAAMQAKSAVSVGCPAEVYQQLVDNAAVGTVSNWNLYNISFALNLIEDSTPQDLCLSLHTYAQLIRDTRAMATVWNDVVDPIKQKLMAVEHQPAGPAAGKKVIPLGVKNRSPKPKYKS